jgi:MtaA/CmuA family methyltransferase
MANSYAARERMTAAFELRRPDRVPVFLNNSLGTSRCIGIKIREMLTNPEKFSEALCAAYDQYGYDGIRVTCDVAVEAEAIGAKTHYPEDGPVSITTPPVKNPEDFEKIKMPNPHTDGRMRVMLKTTELTRRAAGDSAFIISVVQGPLNTASQMLGVSEMMMMIIDEREFLEKVLAFAAELTVLYGKAMHKAGADGLMIGEAVCSPTFIGRDHYVELAKKHHKNIIDELRRCGINNLGYHICGQLSPILLDVAGTGVDSIDLDSPVDMKAAREKLGNRTAILGNISPAELLNAKPERVTKLCADVLSGKEGLGLILGAGCTMAPDTPGANIRAMVEAAKKYGTYE